MIPDFRQHLLKYIARFPYIPVGYCPEKALLGSRAMQSLAELLLSDCFLHSFI